MDCLSEQNISCLRQRQIYWIYLVGRRNILRVKAWKPHSPQWLREHPRICEDVWFAVESFQDWEIRFTSDSQRQGWGATMSGWPRDLRVTQSLWMGVLIFNPPHEGLNYNLKHENQLSSLLDSPGESHACMEDGWRFIEFSHQAATTLKIQHMIFLLRM